MRASCFSQGSQAISLPAAARPSISQNARTTRPAWFLRALGVASVRLKPADAGAGWCPRPRCPGRRSRGKGAPNSQPGSFSTVLCAPPCAAPGWRRRGLGQIPDAHIDPQRIQRLHIWRNVLVTSVCRVPSGPPPRMYSCCQTPSPSNSFYMHRSGIFQALGVPSRGWHSWRSFRQDTGGKGGVRTGYEERV